MKAGKLLLIAGCIALTLAGLLAATSGASKPAAKTRVAIYKWPHGVFGYVKSPKAGRCASHRRVAVFKQRGGKQHSRRDKRVASVRTHRNHGFQQWSTRIDGVGPFYAKAKRSPGCRPGFSRTVRARPSGEGPGGDAGGAPPCSPYVREGPTSVCKFEEMRVDIKGSCTYTRSSGDCGGTTLSGPLPWGTLPQGGFPRSMFFWKPEAGDRNLLYVAYNPLDRDDHGIAHLGGTVPGHASAAFTITDGFAQDDRGYPNGEHFFTPDIPGQEPGERGGPLYLDFGGQVKVRGYLYLKQ